jgi:outer membrane receptor for ferrienterochelin and colicin
MACTVAVYGVAAAQEAKRPAALEDVIVTATKRDVSLQDVAGSVSAMTQDDLKQMGAQSLSDYINKMPGVQFNDYQPGVSEVIMRGVSATTYHEQGQTVVGYYINEIPLAEAGWPVVIPDIDTLTSTGSKC